MFSRIRSFFRPVYLRIPDLPPAKLAFILDGKKYFHFEDLNSYPILRFLQIIEHCNEIKMNVDKDFLEATVYSIQQMLTPKDGKVDLVQAINTLNDIGSRLQDIAWPELLYKYGAAIFFEEGEDPRIVDSTRTNKKIELFKKKINQSTFFSHPIMKEFIPSWASSEETIQIYTNKANLDHLKAIERLISNLNLGNCDQSTINFFQSQKEKLKDILKLHGVVS